MAKKKSWFYLVKILFISEANTEQEKKEKKRKWMLGRFKAKQLGALAAAIPLKGKTLSELEEEQSKHALNVAIATAAAAEAAVAAARAAAEVVHLSVSPQSQPQFERGSRDLAAVKIQTAFRGYLARKALRALKGLVKLQAMVRGRAVRRQAITTLRSLQSLVKIQSQACKMRIRTVEVGRIGEEKKQLQGRNRELGGEETRRSWDGSFLSKEEIKAMFLSRVDATIKRERTKKYSFNHQKRRSESDTNMVDGMHDNWLEQWVDSQARKREGLQNFDSIACLNSIDRDVEGGMHRRMIDTLKHEQLEGMNSQISLPRRSFHQQKCSLLGANHSCSSFLAVPGYMAATESAKAKARSISSPKQGLGISDGYYDHSSPSKNRLSLCSSHSSDTTCISRIGNPSGCQQRSPCIKGLSGLTKSHQTSKDLSFDSELSVLNWSQRGSFR